MNPSTLTALRRSNSSLTKQQTQLPSAISFTPYDFSLATNRQNRNAANFAELSRPIFSQQENKWMKNAFRYISRLALKEAAKHIAAQQSDRRCQTTVLSSRSRKKVKEEEIERLSANQSKQMSHQTHKIQQQTQKAYQNSFPEFNCRHSLQGTLAVQPTLPSHPSLMNLISSAESLSGLRMFASLLETLPPTVRLSFLKYFHWFLSHKYLKFVHDSAEMGYGKRKEMKTELYVRYKNLVMVGMVEAWRSQAEREAQTEIKEE